MATLGYAWALMLAVVPVAAAGGSLGMVMVQAVVTLGRIALGLEPAAAPAQVEIDAGAAAPDEPPANVIAFPGPRRDTVPEARVGDDEVERAA